MAYGLSTRMEMAENLVDGLTILLTVPEVHIEYLLETRTTTILDGKRKISVDYKSTDKTLMASHVRYTVKNTRTDNIMVRHKPIPMRQADVAKEILISDLETTYSPIVLATMVLKELYLIEEEDLDMDSLLNRMVMMFYKIS